MAGLIQHNGAGDYASLNAAVAVGAGAITISGDWAGDDTTDVTWGNACTVRISGDSLNKVGKPGRAGGSYRLVKANAGADHVFTVSADVDIWDMDIMSDSSGVSDEIFRMSSVASLDLRRCYIGFSGNVNQQDGVYYDWSDDGETFLFEQCQFFDIGRSIIDCYQGEADITINFNSCSSLNIGANNGRLNASWVGIDVAGATTVAINVHNCLLNGSDTYIFACSGSASMAVDCTYSLTNVTAANLSNGEASEDTTGSDFEYTWTEAADPGAGDRVGMLDITNSPYDQRLRDHANNDAQDFHAVETDAGLSIPGTDIIGTARPQNVNYDVGSFEIVSGAPAGLSIPIAMHHYTKNIASGR